MNQLASPVTEWRDSLSEECTRSVYTIADYVTRSRRKWSSRGPVGASTGKIRKLVVSTYRSSSERWKMHTEESGPSVMERVIGPAVRGRVEARNRGACAIPWGDPLELPI